MARRLHRYVENQGWNLIYHHRIENMAEAVGFEPTTQGIEIPCAIQTALRPGKIKQSERFR